MSSSVLGEAVGALLSLGVVLGLILLVGRVLRRGSGTRGGPALRVLSRVPVGRGSAVVVVRVGERALVVGVTEQRVTLLAESALAEFDVAEFDVAGSAVAGSAMAGSAVAGSAVAGSAVDSVTEVGGSVGLTRARPGELGELAELSALAGLAGLAGENAPVRATPTASGRLAGSVLAPQTWRQTVEVLRERTVRRG